MGVGFGTDEEDRRRVHEDDHGRTRWTDRDHGIEAAMAAAAAAAAADVTQPVMTRLFLFVCDDEESISFGVHSPHYQVSVELGVVRPLC